MTQNLSEPSQISYFLALTAQEEYWDTSKPLIFLGEWCLPYSRKEYWEPLGGVVLDSPWKDRKKTTDAYAYVNDVYERILPVLAAALNRIHNINHSERYWRIIIGPWLQWYISVLYDRYISIKAVMEEFPDFATIGLAESSFITPRDTTDFSWCAYSDHYNYKFIPVFYLF